METADVSVALPRSPTGRLRTTALALFDYAASAHALPERLRPLLLLALDCSIAALACDTQRAERGARDAALAFGDDHLDSEDRAIAACVVAFQRVRPRPEREAAFLRLSPRDRERALRLAALFQLADAIADSPAAWLRVQASTSETVATISGPGCVDTARELAPRAQPWCEQIGQLTLLGRAGDAQQFADEPEQPAEGALPLVPGELSGDEAAGEGSRRMLRRLFERMLAREDDVRTGEDPEDVHQMRVATRRLRASLQVVEGIFAAEAIRGFRRELRRVAEPLGVVRDADVFLIALREEQQRLGGPDAAALDPLIRAVEAERAAARVELLDDFNSRRYERFKHAFAVFLTTPRAGLTPAPESGAPRVRDVAGSAIWRRYEELRAFEPALADGASDHALHQARISGKRLRYTLEFFAPALGARVDELLERLAELQEHLGLLQDGVAARAHIDRLGMLADPGACAYLDHLTARHDELSSAFPRLWERIVSATYRRRLMELLIRL